MSKGSPEPEDRRDQRCEHCGLFYSVRGINSHERNCEWSEYDAVHPHAKDVDEDPDDLEDDVDAEGSDPNAEGDTPTPDDAGVGESPEPAERVDPDTQKSETEDSGGTPSTATDGGPRTPPTPDVDLEGRKDSPDPTSRDVDDLPERFVGVDTYLREVRSRDPDEVNVDELATLLESFDVVDVDATTTTNVAAYRWEDVA